MLFERGGPAVERRSSLAEARLNSRVAVKELGLSSCQKNHIDWMIMWLPYRVSSATATQIQEMMSVATEPVETSALGRLAGKLE